MRSSIWGKWPKAEGGLKYKNARCHKDIGRLSPNTPIIPTGSPLLFNSPHSGAIYRDSPLRMGCEIVLIAPGWQILKAGSQGATPFKHLFLCASRVSTRVLKDVSAIYHLINYYFSSTIKTRKNWSRINIGRLIYSFDYFFRKSFCIIFSRHAKFQRTSAFHFSKCVHPFRFFFCIISIIRIRT